MSGAFHVVAGVAAGSLYVTPLVGGLTQDISAGTTATCGWEFNVDGTIDRNRLNLGDTVNQQQWLKVTGGTPGNTHWIRLTVNSGITPGTSSIGTWLQLNTARQWTLSRSTVGTNVANCTVEIATDSGGTNIVTSGTYTFSSERIE